MAGIKDSLYSMLITALVGKAEGYGATISYNHEYPYYKNCAITQSGSYRRWNYELIDANVVDDPEAAVFKINKTSVLGMLAEEPVWHHGPALYEGISTINPAINTSDTSGYSFLEVQEIPNSARGGYFVQAGLHDPQTDKYFNGFYWPSYSRMLIQTRTPDLTYSLTQVMRSTYEGTATYLGTGSEYAQDILTYINKRTTVEKDDGTLDQEFQIYLTNENAIYMGENEDSIAWPGCKYFGIFNTMNVPTSLVYDNNTPQTAYMEDQNLLYWGQLEENDNWYHEWTYDSTEWTTIYPLLYYKVDNVWTLNTSSTYDSSKTYYKKFEEWNYRESQWYILYNNLYYINTDGSGNKTLVKNSSLIYDSSKTYYKVTGVVVKSGQGGVFSKNKFQIRWNSDIISNKFTTT